MPVPPPVPRISFDVIFYGVFGLLLCTHWIFFPMPERSRLTEHNGALEAFSVETAKYSWRERKAYVFFKVTGESLRFWTDAVKPEQAAKVFSRPGATVRFYIDEKDNHLLMNGARKSYGLVVDGREIQKVGAALRSDRFFGLIMLPLMGVGSLVYALYRWQNPTAEKV